MPTVRCRFYARTPTEGGYHYDPITINNPEGEGTLPTDQPPAVGDLIHLWDTLRKHGGVHRVIARQWLHSAFGSTNWPYTERLPMVGPELLLIVEKAGGVFEDEVVRPDADGEDGEEPDHA